MTVPRNPNQYRKCFANLKSNYDSPLNILLAYDEPMIVSDTNCPAFEGNIDKSVNYNLTQIFRTSFEISPKYADNPSSDEWITKKQYTLGIHMKDIEGSFFFNPKPTCLEETGKPFRLTGGLSNLIRSNKIILANSSSTRPTLNSIKSKTMSDSEFRDFLDEKVFDNGSHERIVFGGTHFCRRLREYGEKHWGYPQLESFRGLEFTVYYINETKRLLTIVHPLFGLFKCSSLGIFLDFEKIKFCTLGQRDTTLKKNIQSNDSNTTKHEFITECGLYLTDENAHALLENWF